MNLIDGRLEADAADGAPGRSRFTSLDGGLLITLPFAPTSRGGVTLGIRPEQLTVRPATTIDDKTAPGTTIIGQLEGAELLGYESVVHIRVGSIRLTARADPAIVPSVGSPLALSVDVAHVHVFDQATGAALHDAR